jgi:hypothetical protein
MKRAQVDPLKIIILFIILAVVAGIIIYIFTTQVGKEAKIVEEQLEALGDEDDDGVANFLDKCPRQPGVSEYSGCPSESALPT